nr:ribonuclease H [Ipomoea batatas]
MRLGVSGCDALRSRMEGLGDGNADTIMEHLRKMNIEGGCKTVHVYREQNQVANELAKLALCGETDGIEFDESPPECRSQVCNDFMGVCTP